MSRERRFWVETLQAEEVKLSPEEAHHLVQVLRLGEGAEVHLFDGKGNAARARVHRIVEGEVALRILGPEPSRESPLRITIAVSPPKGDRASFLVEKLTELGVAAIVPLETERGSSRESLERWRRIAVSSCKQSGRSRVPAIEPMRSVASVLEEPGLVLAAQPGAPPLSIRGASEVLVLIGPEGGWSEREAAILATRGATRFGMGPRTLRTETAAVAAAAVLQYLLADLGGA